MFEPDVLRCDSVAGERWFPEQPVTQTEGLFVKENTGQNLSMFNEQRGRTARWRWGAVAEKVGCRD